MPLAVADAHTELAIPGASTAGIAYVLWLEALLAEHDGRPDAMSERLELALAQATAAGADVIVMWYGPEAVRLAIAAGRADVAERMADEVTRVATKASTAIAGAAARRCRGLVGGHPDLLVEAVELLRGGGRPLDFAMASESAGSVLARAGRRDEAVAVLADGLAVFERIGATLVTRRIAGALRKLGAPQGVRGGRRRPTSGWESLTPTEVEVVDLVAQGLSNPEVGHRLHVSRKTVETHLSHVFGKLGVTSRAALAAEAARRESVRG